MGPDGHVVATNAVGVCVQPADVRFNVSTTCATTDLHAVQSLLAQPPPPDFVSIGTTKMLQSVLRPTVGSLDLITHSRGGVLYFGCHDGFYTDCGTDGDARFIEFVNWLKNNIPELGINKIRLLGCVTALTVAGQNAMKALQTQVSVPVIGTTVVIDVTCFDERGFSVDNCVFLKDCGHLPPPHDDITTIRLGVRSPIVFDVPKLPSAPAKPWTK